MAFAHGRILHSAPEEVPMASGRQQGGWQLEEDSADAYERYLVPAIFASMAERLVELADVNAGERVLDVACGTGIVARAAARRVGSSGQVVGIDVNEGMLAVARRVSSSLRPAIDWRQGDAAALPLADGGFDAVLCEQAFQFFPDRPKVLREMRRVLVPRGRAVLAVLRPLRFSPAYVPVAEALARHVGPEAGAMMRSPFPDWDREQLRAMVREGGFSDVHVRVDVGQVRYPSAAELLRQEAASSPLAGPLGVLEGDVRQALIADLESALRDHEDDDGIVAPLESFVVVARG
jgi:ubiquinone/menaquinone biosynthesis C-methylase UbiE